MQHSRARDVARADFPDGEQNEGTTRQRAQGEEPDESRKDRARQKFESEEGVKEEGDEIAQNVESRCETEDRPQAGSPRPEKGGQKDGFQEGRFQKDGLQNDAGNGSTRRHRTGRRSRKRAHAS
jgi:hypothetical protein